MLRATPRAGTRAAKCWRRGGAALVLVLSIVAAAWGVDLVEADGHVCGERSRGQNTAATSGTVGERCAASEFGSEGEGGVGRRCATAEEEEVDQGGEARSGDEGGREEKEEEEEEEEEEEVGNAAVSCSVLEWRLIGRFDQGGVPKSILSGRSCSICGWVGCEKCEREMECPLWLGGGTVKYLDDPDRLDDADVVLVPATGDLGNFDIPTRVNLRDDQRIVAIAGESSMWWQHVEHLKDDQRFDMVMGYSRGMSDMHASYVPNDYTQLVKGGLGEELEGLDVGEMLQPTADIAHFASNCQSDLRQAWVDELMLHVPVDSFGKCNKNRDLPEELTGAQGRMDRDEVVERLGGKFTAQQGQAVVKRAVVSLYKFGLAFENTIETDYVTEKIFEVMRAGAVPVYLGAPNWREFVPMNHSVIDASEFDSPEDLAKFLSDLSNDDERYQEYHRWRMDPLPEQVRALEETSFVWNLCRVCEWWKGSRGGEGGGSRPQSGSRRLARLMKPLEGALSS